MKIKLVILFLFTSAAVWAGGGGLEFENSNIYSVTQSPNTSSLKVVLRGGKVIIHGEEGTSASMKIDELTLTVDRFRGDGPLNDRSMTWEKQVATIMDKRGKNVSAVAFGTTVVMENGVLSYLLVGRLYIDYGGAK